jgi:hypothetical protein
MIAPIAIRPGGQASGGSVLVGFRLSPSLRLGEGPQSYGAAL